ncbi:MnhB domain-containing protein [Natronomonas salsuginis]|uniref:Cation:proton antiporter n=1 Tax=Natronomonas salsuginis TaxID=2217661 RepID=A0A4U5J818_9EURY|nr:MnhB domain-containing protein [Natronomonas salsuginis]TKR25230.1 cation:proton antiporter [Natronomonas salsuginis]
MSDVDAAPDVDTRSGAAAAAASESASDDAEQAAPEFDPDRPYTESEIIMTAVRVVTPFVLTYGFFMTFHGADSPGGGFQGGALVAVVVFMLAFAFGIRPTREWVGSGVMTGLAAGGVIVFASVGLGALGLGGAFLEYGRYARFIGPDATKWGMEAIEIGGVAPIVAGVIMGLFFLTAAGYELDGGDEE